MATFYVQSISLPEELQAHLDKLSSMNMLGDMQRYTQFQTAESIPLAAQNEGGLAGAGAGIGAGVAMGQAMATAMNPNLNANMGMGSVAAGAAAGSVAQGSVKMLLKPSTSYMTLLAKAYLPKPNSTPKKLSC